MATSAIKASGSDNTSISKFSHVGNAFNTVTASFLGVHIYSMNRETYTLILVGMAKLKGYRKPYSITIPLEVDPFMIWPIIRSVEVVLYRYPFIQRLYITGYKIYGMILTLYNISNVLVNRVTPQCRTKDLLHNFLFFRSGFGGHAYSYLWSCRKSFRHYTSSLSTNSTGIND